MKIRKLIYFFLITTNLCFAAKNTMPTNQEAEQAGNLAKEIKSNCLKEVKKTPFFYNTKVLGVSFNAEQFAIIETWFFVKNSKAKKTYLLCMYDSTNHKAVLYETEQ